MIRSKYILIIFFCSLGIFISMFIYIIHDYMRLEHHFNKFIINNNISIEPPAGRILVILIDSLQKDTAFSDQMPFLSNYRKRGAWGISEVTSTPLSIAGDRAIFAGIMSSPFALLDDFNPGTASHDNIILRLTRQGKKVSLFGSLIDSAYGVYTYPRAYYPSSFRFGEYQKELWAVYQQAYAYLKNNHWDFAVVQFLGLDHLGHLETPNSLNFRNYLSSLDGCLENLIGITTAEDIVLITSEHGIDNKGFHTDRNPLITQTPFVLVGIPIKEGGPKKIPQIDLAPTLSILSGISPFYRNFSLPALDLIKDYEEKYAAVLKEFSRIYTGKTDLSTIEAIRHARNLKMTKQTPCWQVFLISAVTILTAIVLAYIAIYTTERKRSFPEITFIGLILLSIIAIVGALSFLNILDQISNTLSFSANFFKENMALTIAIFTLLAAVARLSCFIFRRHRIFLAGGHLLFSFTLVFCIIYISENPYNILNWAIFSIPLAGIAISGRHRLAWASSLAALWIGLSIRRLTFYNSYNAIDMPERWLLCAVMLLLAIIIFMYRYHYKHIDIQKLIPVIISFVSALIVIYLPMAPEWRTIFLLLLFLVLMIFTKDHDSREIWFALWVVFFYLGTSSRIENTTHMVALFLLLTAWSAAREASPVTKGIIITFVVWSLYLLPGNSFDLKLQDVSDSYLIGSASEKSISTTILIIISRYVSPVVILIWGVTSRDPLTHN